MLVLFVSGFDFHLIEHVSENSQYFFIHVHHYRYITMIHQKKNQFHQNLHHKYCLHNHNHSHKIQGHPYKIPPN